MSFAPQRHRARRLCAAACLAVLMAACADLGPSTGSEEAVAPGDAETDEDASADAVGGRGQDVAALDADDAAPDVTDVEATRPERRDLAEPTSLSIPAIDVDEDLIEVGYNDDRTMEVPDFGDAAWFNGQPKPGERGAAVVAAHVDSRHGPDVFYDLGALEPGDEVHVDRADGETETFVVDRLEQHPKDDFPHEQVYGHTSEPTLRLITCDGLFDSGEGSYTDNLIVYAEHVP